MAIIRASRPEKNFSVIHNSTLEDQDLSWEALGMLTYLLSKPDGWQVKPSHLRAFRSAGRDKVRRIMGELEEAGYLVREKHRNEKGGGNGSRSCTIPPNLPKTPQKRRLTAMRPETGFPATVHPPTVHPPTETPLI